MSLSYSLIMVVAQMSIIPALTVPCSLEITCYFCAMTGLQESSVRLPVIPPYTAVGPLQLSLFSSSYLTRDNIPLSFMICFSPSRYCTLISLHLFSPRLKKNFFFFELRHFAGKSMPDTKSTSDFCLPTCLLSNNELEASLQI